MEYKRNCPECGKELVYTMGGNYKRAIKNNSVCRNCRKMPDTLKDTLSKKYKGKKNPKYKKRSIDERPKNFELKCPNCGIIRYYVKEYSYRQAIKNGTECAKCASITKIQKYGKAFILTQDQLNTMAARKAGYDTFEEYSEQLTEFKKYKRLVMSITYKQPLEILENYDKKGKMGQEGAYNIDHIISIKKGFIENINPEIIGHISNLRMIPWLENIQKWCN